MRDLIQSAADAATGGSIAELARLLHTPDRTVRAWLAETRQPSAIIVLFLRLIVARPQVAKWLAS